jgi:hypothetical protein
VVGQHCSQPISCSLATPLTSLASLR